MDERIDMAKRGRKLWLSFVEANHISNAVYVVLLPSDNRDYNEPALFYLKRFLDKRGVKKAIVLTFDTWVEEQQEKYCEWAQIMKWDRKDIEALIQFYCLYEFSPNVVIASLSQPAGRMGDGLIGKKGLSKEEVFAGIVYSLVD